METAKTMSEFLENITGKADSFFTSRKMLLFALCSGVIFALFYMIFCNDMYRDVAFCYARYAREFGEGSWNGKAIFQLPPLHIFLGGLLVKCGVPAYGAVISISCLFYLATIFPLYYLLKRFLSDRLAALGCILFIFAPRLIRFSGMALLEPGRDFFLILAVWMIFRILDEPEKLRYAAFAGFAMGGMVLARGEGIMLALLLQILLIIYLVIDSCKGRKNPFRYVIAPWAVMILALLLVLTPRLIETWHLSGYPVPDGRILRLLQVENDLIQRPTEEQRAAAVFSAKDEIMDGNALDVVVPFNAAQLNSFFSNVARGAYELYLFLAVVGSILLLRRREWKREFTFIWLFILILLPGFYKICFSYRYFIFMIPLLMVFTLTGLKFFADLAGKIPGKWGRICFPVLIAACLIAQAVNGVSYVFRSEGRENRKAVAWLHENRSRLLFEGQSGNLKILSPDYTLVFLADEEPAIDFGDIPPSLEMCKSFNAVLVHRKMSDTLARFRRDPEMVEETGFPAKNFILFRPAKEKNLPAPEK